MNPDNRYRSLLPVNEASVGGSCSPAESLPAGRVDESSAIDAERFAAMCKALGHPTRLQIVRLLMGVETCVCGDIVQKLPLAQSTVSQHLKILKDAGLVRGEIDGPRTCYALDHEALAEFRGLSEMLL
jgi:ArsR family transcriptional regulator, arsenate/arsenite/antimonite-responsive transcriptional repressor